MGLFQFQIIVADVIMVLSTHGPKPPRTSDDELEQALRMYHIYEKNPFICIIPSISIPALFGESVFFSPLVSLRLRDQILIIVAVTIALTNQLRDLSTPHDQKMLGDLSTACFCLTILQVLCESLSLFGAKQIEALTQRFINSVTAYLSRVSGSDSAHLYFSPPI